MNRELVQWQIMDETCGCVYPWFTHPFLEVLKTWDLKDKVVLEYGAGRSTAWWAMKAKCVISIEANEGWYGDVEEELSHLHLDNVLILGRFINEGDPDQARRDSYIHAADKIYVDGLYGQTMSPVWQYHIVVVDGIFRYECMQHGIKLLSKRGGILIVDNWQQDGFICPACAELVAPYEGHVYRQEDHTDHHGNPWQTAYWRIPAHTS